MPSIKTERLTLRPLELRDAPAPAAASSDWDVARMVSTLPFPHPAIAVEGFILIEQARRALALDHVFAIETRDGRVIGVCGAHVRGRDYQGRNVEIGYWLGRPHWGRGYATEAAAAIADFGVELGRGPLIARHFADNPASGRVLSKIGFRYTGERRLSFSLARGVKTESLMMERPAAFQEVAA